MNTASAASIDNSRSNSVLYAGFTLLRVDLFVRGVKICLPLKEPQTLSFLRPILAMLIALSLAVAPITSAWAAMQMRTTVDGPVTASAGSDDVMSDCMKAMQAKGQEQNQDCPCCDTKSKCPDMTACLMKCGTQVIGIVMPVIQLAALTGRHFRPSDPQEPPDWSLRPPAPPPRA